MKKRIISTVLATCLAFSSFATGALTVNAATVSDTDVSASGSVVVSANKYGLKDNIQDGVILHCFDWKYNDIKAELPNIAKAGFTSIQTSPAQAGGGTGTWWWLYQPLGFYVGTNELGTKSELKSLCDEAEKYGIKVVVDVVANHLAGNHSNIDNDLKPSQYWHTFGGNVDWTNRWQVTHGEIGMPDLATENSYVQQKVGNYVKELRSIGVDGIRWDAAKHIGLPSENDNFWSSVTQYGLYNYGEILKAPDDRQSGNEGLMKEYTNYITVTDSDYGKTLRDSFNSGNAPDAYGNWSARGIANNKLIYWAESHDTWSNNKDWGYSNDMSQNVIDRAYAVAASRNKVTALYFSRPSSKVKDSIKIGQKGSTHFTSKEVAEVNRFHNAMDGKSDYYKKSNGCSVITRKDGGAVIVKGSGSGNVSVENGGGYAKSGTYKDAISGNTFTITSSNISGTVGSSGIAVIYEAEPEGPSASVTPGSKSYKTDTLTLTLNCENATSAQYSIDEGSYVSYNDGKQITIGSGADYGTKTTVTVKASDGKTTSTPETYTYTKVDPAATQKIYFDNSTYKWSSVYAYIYNDDGSSGGGSNPDPTPTPTPQGTIKFTDNQGWGNNIYAYFWADNKVDLGGVWPGTKMGNPENNGLGQNNYSCSIPDGATYVIFTNGFDQTQEISLSGFEGYYTDGSRDSNGHLNATGWNTGTTAMLSAVLSEPVEASDSNVTENAKWPGVEMILDSSTGYYVTEVPEGLENGNVIFSDGTDSAAKRYPQDMEPGLPLNSATKLFKANDIFEDYTPAQPTRPTQPTTKPTEPTTQPTDKLNINVKSNVFTNVSKSLDKNTKKVTFTFKLTSNMLVENAQWKMTFDNSKLKYSSENNSTRVMPKVKGAQVNCTGNTIYGCFSDADMFNFMSNRTFVSVSFDVIGTGTADVNFDLQVLTLGYKDSNGKVIDASIVDNSQIVNISSVKGFEKAKISGTDTLIQTGTIKGDINGDGVINIKDATLIQQYVVKMTDLDSEQKQAADVDNDGLITVTDSTVVMKYIVDLVSEL